ncbi:ATP-binding protein [Kribbella sp. VKM Ac-2568]|uniref:ATP-binding protein n=1 Tax=Kribbella sp. VKM Ac-2568 TaxID=2512219 RepID=UPI0010F34894|nr:ATP-binding protein [Kribbella sp. VKM Ac-2568]TCM35992.1 ATPase family protein associated with various cellular activities (AAA) [Kribbella sp. VKM Ac-2568]
MSRTRAILAGPFASTPFANGLRMFLAGSGRFDTVEAADHAAVDDLLLEDGPVVVIAEGIDLRWALDLLDRAGQLSVVLLDDAGRRAVMTVDDPGAQHLVRLIEELGVPDRAGAGTRPIARLHLVDPSHASGSAEVQDPTSPLNLDAQPPRPESSRGLDSTAVPSIRSDPASVDHPASVDLTSVTTWLSLVLGVRLRERAEGANEPSFAGWTASPSDALAGLGLENNTADELRARFADTDRGVIVDRRGLPAVLAAAARSFALSDGELRALLVALAPELDARFGVAIGVLHDDLNRRRPSVTLLDELGESRFGAWRCRQELEATGSLLGRRLLVPDRRDPTVPVVEAGLLPLPALIASLFSPTIDAAARATGARLVRSRGVVAAAGAEQRAAQQLEAAIAGADGTALVRLAEPAGGWFERVAAATGLTLVDGDLAAVADGRPIDDAITSWLCLAAMTGAGLHLRGVGELTAPDHRRLGEALRSFAGTVVAVVYDGPSPDIESDCPAVVLRRPELDVGERIDLWSSAAANSGLVLSEVDATALATTLPLGPSEIANAVARFAVQPLEADEPIARQLRQVAIDQRSHDLPPTVRSIATRFAWDDLVLADPAKAELRSIMAHFTLSASVLDRWGFVDRLTYGRGVSALFSGPSGTGKTMAAQVLALELGVELLLVDLSKTVSKYLGETEKNIDAAFRVAEGRGALLLFDEADALFGKRSEVKDAHDRHANVEVAYLLQRMEAFEGIAILTTNLKQNIDDAFLRRLRFLVDFPLPDAAAREVIWQHAFPERAPLADDIDFGFLGRRLQLSGGTIQQIALHAAFAAVDDGPIRMRHILAATRRELDKLGMFDAGRALEARAARAGAA